MEPELIRTCRFSPYRKGCGPTFTLRLYDCFSLHNGGPQPEVRAELRRHEGGVTKVVAVVRFGCSPLDAIDSDRCVMNAIGWVTYVTQEQTGDENWDGVLDGERLANEDECVALEYEARARFKLENY